DILTIAYYFAAKTRRYDRQRPSLRFQMSQTKSVGQRRKYQQIRLSVEAVYLATRNYIERANARCIFQIRWNRDLHRTNKFKLDRLIFTLPNRIDQTRHALALINLS